jgi:hypothetical protein
MNAVVHGGGGEAELTTDGHGTVQIRIRDGGEKAVRTAGQDRAPGYGWWLIARAADRVWIYPGEPGMTVILEQDREAPDTGLDSDARADAS